MTTTSVKASGKSSEEVLVLNKDGEITRVNRGAISVASSLVQQSVYFKLGRLLQNVLSFVFFFFLAVTLECIYHIHVISNEQLSQHVI